MAELSSEKRDGLRERALALNSEPHPDDPSRRKFGGPQPGSGRPRKPRVGEIGAQAAEDHAAEIVAALLAGVTDESNPEKRSRAADRWARLALQQGAQEDRSDQNSHQALDLLTKDELKAKAARVVLNLLREGQLTLPAGHPLANHPIIEAQVE